MGTVYFEILQLMRIKNMTTSNILEDEVLDEQDTLGEFDEFHTKDSGHLDLITNWSKTHIIGFKQQVVKVFSELQLIELLQESNRKLKVFGSRLSYEPISQADQQDLLIDLQLFGIASQSENTVEVYGGTTLQYLFEHILQKGKMLHNCPGVISCQTVAGAISTGTHGQGIKQSTLSDSVIQLTVVDARGNIKQISEENEDFGAYLTSMGCLGIITRVKFALVKNKIYHCKKLNSTFDHLLNHFQKLTEEKIQTKAWWFPWTDEVQLWYMEEATEQDNERYLAGEKRLIEASELDRSLQNTITLVKDKMARDTKNKEEDHKNLQVLSRFEVVSDVIGNIYQIMNKGIPIPQINCEIAVDLNQLKPLLLRLREWFSKHKQSMHYPFILRPTGKSKSWLSSTYDRISLHVGFLIYISEDGSYVKGSLDLLREIQSIIVQYGGKPHMGKKFSCELYDFEERYEKWREFKSVMIREDPEGRFRNRFMNRLFGMGCAQ